MSVDLSIRPVMPIIEEVAFDDNVAQEKNDRKKIITIQFYRKKKLRESARKIEKMFRSSENNIIRPRKIHGSWMQQPSAKIPPVFQLGEYHHEGHDYALALPIDSTLNSNKKHNLESTKPNAKAILHHIENYCDKSNLHGLRYVGDTSLSLGERVFWVLAFGAALTFASYYITKIFEKWDQNPVLVAFNPTDATFNEIPFPAITICNMNQAKKGEAERILKEHNDVEKRLLTDYCNTNRNNGTFDSSGDGPPWHVVQDFLVKVGQSCADMVKACIWQNDPISCPDVFNNDLTDEGLCCSFNRLPPQNIFRNPNDLTLLNLTFPKQVYDWSPEKGFLHDNTGDFSTVPIRPSGPGTSMGLTVVVDAQIDNYFCSSTSSVGFKIILSNPIETPKIMDYGFMVSPGVEARYVITPEIRQASEALRYISIDKRQCFFQNERPLLYYRTYTKKNCRLECQSNHTLHKCMCIPHYLPKSKRVKICGRKEEQCVNTAKEDMELVYGNGSSCNCLASCHEMNFDKTASYSTLLDINIAHSQLENITNEYFRKNMAVLHFFFKDSKFRKQIKSEIYGFTEVLSNVGGLLGLCLGFSFLSLVEIGYFLTLKVLCSCYQSRKMKKEKKRKERRDKYPNSVIPFMR